MGGTMERARQPLQYGVEVVPPRLRRQILSMLVVLLLVGAFLMLAAVLAFRRIGPARPPPAPAPAPVTSAPK